MVMVMVILREKDGKLCPLHTFWLLCKMPITYQMSCRQWHKIDIEYRPENDTLSNRVIQMTNSSVYKIYFYWFENDNMLCMLICIQWSKYTTWMDCNMKMCWSLLLVLTRWKCPYNMNEWMNAYNIILNCKYIKLWFYWIELSSMKKIRWIGHFITIICKVCIFVFAIQSVRFNKKISQNSEQENFVC